MSTKTHSILLTVALSKTEVFALVILLSFVVVTEVFAGSAAGLEQAKSNIISIIQEGNFTEAQAQTQKLLTDFPQDPALPKVLYEIAEGFRWSFKTDKDKYAYARIFYEQVMKSYPDSTYAHKAALGVAKIKVLSNIMAQDFNAAGQALNEMIAGFQKAPNLPDELYWIGRGYGYWERHEEEQNVYQRIIQDYPDSLYADKARIGFAKANVQSLIMSKDEWLMKIMNTSRLKITVIAVLTLAAIAGLYNFHSVAS